jgi:hypothetical protein
MFSKSFSQSGFGHDNTIGASKELRSKELVIDLFFFFMNEEWGMQGL